MPSVIEVRSMCKYHICPFGLYIRWSGSSLYTCSNHHIQVIYSLWRSDITVDLYTVLFRVFRVLRSIPWNREDSEIVRHELESDRPRIKDPYLHNVLSNIHGGPIQNYTYGDTYLLTGFEVRVCERTAPAEQFLQMGPPSGFSFFHVKSTE